MHSGQKQKQVIKKITTAVEIVEADGGMKVRKGKLKNWSIQKQSKK